MRLGWIYMGLGVLGLVLIGVGMVWAPWLVSIGVPLFPLVLIGALFLLPEVKPKDRGPCRVEPQDPGESLWNRRD